TMLAAACGDNGVGSAQPDAPSRPDVPAVEARCERVPQGTLTFETSADFAPAVAGTLAGWNPDGRWFLTGASVGPSSYHFARGAGATIIVDRDAANPGTIDDTEIFQREAFVFNGQTYVRAKRVSNLAADGTARAERAVCGDGTCRICTAKLERATHNQGPDGVEGEGHKLALVGELDDPTWGAGYTFNVRMLGTIAYLIRQDGLHIIETVDPAHPVELGHYQRPGDGYSNDVKLVVAGAKTYALIADYPVDVIDVTDPAHPVLVTNIPQEAHTLAVEHRAGKTYAYFGNYDGTCPVYDVTDPATPQKLGSFSSGGSIVHDLNIEGGIAYLDAWEAGFQAVDFTTPATPHLVGTWAPTPTSTSHSSWTTTVGGRHLALHGEEAYGAHLSILDVDPAAPGYMTPFAEYKTRDHVSIHNIMAFGAKAYFSYYQDGIRVLDLADPTKPVLVGYYNTWDPQADYTTSDFFEGAVGLDVDLARKLVFVADSPRGLLILRDDT
ncbi:MAG: hypothetical protein NT062_31635, partial [Proteobacteria bacterium]|nr:hypothetical protein [Pseudomonadota bacterium]